MIVNDIHLEKGSVDRVVIGEETRVVVEDDDRRIGSHLGDAHNQKGAPIRRSHAEILRSRGKDLAGHNL